MMGTNKLNGAGMKNHIHNFYKNISIKIIYLGLILLSFVYIFNTLINHGFITENTNGITWFIILLAVFGYCKLTFTYYKKFVVTYNKVEKKVIAWVLNWIFNVHGL